MASIGDSFRPIHSRGQMTYQTNGFGMAAADCNETKDSPTFFMTPMPAQLNCHKRAVGFTLVEVLCAIGIGAITITALFSAFSAGFSILTVTREDQRATQILLQKTEAFRLFTWPQLSNCPTTFQEYYYPAGITSSNAGTIYYGTINAIGDPTNIPTSTTYRTNVHLITISVSWTNLFAGKNNGHTRTMQTMNAFNGMQTYLKGK